MKTFIVMFNGPPGSGKDTAVEQCMKAMRDDKLFKGFACSHSKFVDPVRGLLQKGLCLLPSEFEEAKTERRVFDLLGTDIRSFMIDLSENVYKHRDPDFFIGYMIKQIEDIEIVSAHHLVVFISDLGFENEHEKMTSYFGERNVLSIKLHRYGTTFDGDSRDYVSAKNKNVRSVFNDGPDPLQLRDELVETIGKYFGAQYVNN